MATDATPTDVEQNQSTIERFTPASWSVFIAALVMGVIIGIFAAWMTLNMGIATIGFLVGLVGGTWFLNRKRVPSEAIGSGLYITALMMIVTPLFFYAPNLMGADETETAEEAGMVIGSVIGIVIWTFVFIILAIVVAAIGYFSKKRAAKKIEALEG